MAATRRRRDRRVARFGACRENPRAHPDFARCGHGGTPTHTRRHLGADGDGRQGRHAAGRASAGHQAHRTRVWRRGAMAVRVTAMARWRRSLRRHVRGAATARLLTIARCPPTPQPHDQRWCLPRRRHAGITSRAGACGWRGVARQQRHVRGMSRARFRVEAASCRGPPRACNLRHASSVACDEQLAAGATTACACETRLSAVISSSPLLPRLRARRW